MSDDDVLRMQAHTARSREDIANQEALIDRLRAQGDLNAAAAAEQTLQAMVESLGHDLETLRRYRLNAENRQREGR